MAKILIHVTHGPEHPTRAALAFLVARSAIEEGHTVTLFLAGDAVQLLREAVLDNLIGLGTGKLRDHFDAIVAGGGRFFLSGMSSKARGLSDSDLSGKPAEFATPNMLVRLSLEHERMFTYQWDGKVTFVHSRVFCEDGTSTDPGTLSCAQSYARDINDLGQVVGMAAFPGGTHASLWENGSLQDLYRFLPPIIRQ